MTRSGRVTVGVPTFRRNEQLAELLPQLLGQLETLRAAERDVDILVVDNDPDGSAGAVVNSLEDPQVRYVLEPVPGIAAARNRALDECLDRDLLIFIDDDERPTAGWLATLIDAHARYGASAVAGPVLSLFSAGVDEWIRAGGFFARSHRANLVSGTPITVAATNNLLLDLAEVRRLGVRFPDDVKLAGGEDNIFTTAMVRRGGTIVWCAEALVTELVPADRATRRWVLWRSFSGGNALSRGRLQLRRSSSVTLGVRLSLLVGGLGRVGVGLLRSAFGYARRSQVHQARGLRSAARGAGMVLGVAGYNHQAYRRTPVAAGLLQPQPAARVRCAPPSSTSRSGRRG